MSTLPDKYSNIYALKPGQNATVFKAINVLLSRDVFLKIYSVPQNDPLSALREPHLLTSLAHKNLVTIYTADPVSGGNRILLEMELLGDGSIDDMLRQSIHKGHWPSIHTIINITRDIADGLNHLHSNGYVHRDIKPANIMVRNMRTRPEGVITDLGLVSKLDEHGHAQGSKHARLYRPPEIWRGEPYTKASDLYQLGLVLYQLLGGRLNYHMTKLSDQELAKEIIAGTLVDFDSLGVHVHPALHKLVTKLICPQAKRIPDCNKLLEILQRLQTKHYDWELFEEAPTSTVTRSKGTKHIKVEITTRKSHHVLQVYQGDGKHWRRKGKPISLNQKTIRRCRPVRALFDK
jgi:eukaryotic-like serine/threonine-protein kinase